MNGDARPDVRSLTKSDLEHFLSCHGEKKFRADQVYAWLWKEAVHSFEGMTNLPAATRKLLADHFSFPAAIPEIRRHSSDGTVKTGFRLYDGLMVEGVLIPSGSRATACISSQVGCAIGCAFCATGQIGFYRNLTAGEIFDQVTGIDPTPGPSPQREGRKLSNIVFMGMGEPLLNYSNVMAAITKITSHDGLGMSPQRITVSSIGIPKMIRTMADDDPKFHFALSLHAATDAKRNRIIPFNLRHPLPELAESLKYYHKKTGRRFTVEYILFGGFNDTLTDAKELALFCRNFPVKVNIIAYNPVAGAGYKESSAAAKKAFVEYLEGRNMVVNVRLSRGTDIEAACGQLAGKPAGTRP